MIRSKKELKFYIQADRIMAGYEDGGWLHKMKYRLAGSLILVYLKHMRYCAYYRGKGGGKIESFISLPFYEI